MKKHLLSLLAGILGLSGCAAAPPQTDSTAAHQTISAEQAKDMMAETESYVLLDVRTEEEYLESRIAGSVLLPYDRISEKAAEILPDKAQTIFVYCRSGRRSAAAAKTLAGLGYTAVYDFGGISDWPYDTISGGDA